MTSRRLRERRLSRAAARADRPPPSPHPLAKFADKARDLDLVRKSVDDAASVSAGLWLSYLFALFYVGIAAGGVTHKDLLLENPVRLPFLNVELPFVAFFALAPVLFVVSHAYTLMHFVLLASKVGAYNTELAKQIPELDAAFATTHDGAHTLDHREIRRGLRRQLPSNIFVQFLAGPLDIREGGLGWLLKAIAWITLVIGPVLLLLLIQVQFLPYHLEWVTWVQRLAVLADVVLLWFLWPAVLDARGDIRWPRLWRHPVAALVSLVPLALAFAVARFPGEWVEKHVGDARWIPPIHRQAWRNANDGQRFAAPFPIPPRWTSVHNLLFNGDVDDVTRRRKSLFSNTLVLPEFDGLAAAGIDDPKKLDGDGIKHSLVLRGRHLKGAVLTHADLRKADLEAAKLEGANLQGAQLQGARLNRANLQGASLDFAELQGARLVGAQLQGGSLVEAQLQGASLDRTDLREASLNRADLQEASLAGAQLQDASLESADLQSTSLDKAQLQGADLLNVRLQGASLKEAQMQGAFLAKAKLDGASLDGAQLQGAELSHAQLDGASLAGANLQGASLFGATLYGTSLIRTQLQGANFDQASLYSDLRGASIWRTKFNSTILQGITDGLHEKGLSKDAVARLEATFLTRVPEGKSRSDALKRIEILKLERAGPEDGIPNAIERGSLKIADYQKMWAARLIWLACVHDQNSRFMIRGFARNGGIAATGPLATGVIEKILSPQCPVSAALTEQDKADLQRIAKGDLATETLQ
jgi:uncharacterized protein YjbI with pentapeptide repeats